MSSEAPQSTDASPGSELNATDFASMVTAITSAFGDPTRRGIYLFAREALDGVTATEVAEHFDLHPNVARHHLDKLAGGGYLEIDLTRGQRTGAGRPSKRYRTTAKAGALEFPVRHDDVLIALLGRTLALIPPEQAEAVAEEVGTEFGRVMAESMGDIGDQQRSFRAALHAVADALTAHGFAAHAEQHGDGLRIVAEHCPFGGAAIENPVICALDRGMVRGMLGSLYGDASTMIESSVALGDEICVTTVSD